MNTPRKARNIELLIIASERLEPLLDRLVFVGGATTGLLISDPAAPDIRPTKDVDVIVEVQHYEHYQRLEHDLRELGFRESQDEDAPLCRFEHHNLTLDVMPTDEKILGFSNRWYVDAVKTAIEFTLPNDFVLRHTTAPYFIGTKIEAFEGRGQNDFMASHDFEDLIAVINGRPELGDEIANSPDELRQYIASHIRNYLDRPALRQVLPGLIIEGLERVGIVSDRLQRIAALK